MNVSVVIIAKNEEKNIGKCIRSIQNADEIIVVDGNSKDKTREIARSLGAKVVIEKKKCGFGHARNLGIKKSKNEIVAFISADAVASKNWLKEIVAPLKEPDVVATFGPQKIRKREIKTLVDELLYKKNKEIKEYPWWSTPNAACKKSIILKLGGFDENIPAAEDALMGLKIKSKGYKIVWCPKAVVYHEEHLSIISWLKKRYKEALAEGIISKNFKLLKRSFLKSLILPTLIILFIFSLLFKWFLIFVPFLYILMVIRNIKKGNTIKIAFISPPILILSYIVSSVGFWLGYFKKS